MIVWDRGVWTPQGDPQEGYRKGKLKFSLEGEKLAGSWNLVRTQMDGKKEQWFLIKSRDEAAREESEYDIVTAEPDSVLSDRTLVRARARRPAWPKPRLRQSRHPPRSGHRPGERQRSRSRGGSGRATGAFQTAAGHPGRYGTGRDWRYEIKFDGYRMLARIDAGEVRLFTRNGHDWTAKMPQQAAALAGLGLESGWLDGEVVVPNEEGTPDFQALQNAFEAGAAAAFSIICSTCLT